MDDPEATQWAQLVFGQANLDDPRRTKRLVQLTSDMAENASSSILKACGTSGKIEGAYRFIRHEKMKLQTQALSILKRLFNKDPSYWPFKIQQG